MQDTCGIIALRLTFHRVPGKMRTAERNAAETLPVSGTFIIGESHFPARRGVQFVENEFFAELLRHGIHERRNVHGKVILAKIVHSGVIHIFVIPHHASAHCRLRGKVILVQNVSRYEKPVSAAPFMIRLGEVFEKKFLLHFDKVVSFLAEIVFRVAEPQKRQPFFYFIALAFFKLFKKFIGVRYFSFGVFFLSAETVEEGVSVRLVGENAFYRRSEQFAERFEVFFVSKFDKTLGGGFVHRVGVSVTVIETVGLHIVEIKGEHALVFLFFARQGDFTVIFRRFAVKFNREKPEKILGFFKIFAVSGVVAFTRDVVARDFKVSHIFRAEFLGFGYVTAASSARPAILVVKIRFQSVSGKFFGGAANEF